MSEFLINLNLIFEEILIILKLSVYLMLEILLKVTLNYNLRIFHFY